MNKLTLSLVAASLSFGAAFAHAEQTPATAKTAVAATVPAAPAAAAATTTATGTSTAVIDKAETTQAAAATPNTSPKKVATTTSPITAKVEENLMENQAKAPSEKPVPATAAAAIRK
ncbi:hypothetical protein H8K52_03055 [Undibacterium seohonense]|uniref:Uncharacterized protein n=1 Tax=Undibacterium seohonense TaxID=1344950 RepID=A0ABR6X1T2_9BURK|nr:hypothetical protein [Undibacterium seohonense]MBC3806324.1 hypothetical protein [Undibacterium seohonense]